MHNYEKNIIIKILMKKIFSGEHYINKFYKNILCTFRIFFKGLCDNKYILHEHLNYIGDITVLKVRRVTAFLKSRSKYEKTFKFSKCKKHVKNVKELSIFMILLWLIT